MSIQEIRDKVVEHILLNTSSKNLLALTAIEIEKTVFKRNHLRLTSIGCKALAKIVQSYTYEHDNLFKAKHIMALSNLTYPYYLSSKYFVLFSGEDALMLSLHGDVKTFLEQSNLFR